jgi:DNA polymerase III subunit delta
LKNIFSPSFINARNYLQGRYAPDLFYFGPVVFEYSMSLLKRNKLPALLSKLSNKDFPQIILFFGERYLCKESGDLFESALLQKIPGTVHPIDGDHEDQSQTLAKLQSFSLLPGLQIHRVTDSKLFHTKNIAPSLWTKAANAHEAKKPNAAIRHLRNLLGLSNLSTEDSLSQLTKEQWQSHFGFAKPPGDLSWADTLLNEPGQQKKVKKSAQDTTEKYIEAFEKGLPPHSVFLLSAENVDKRKKLFTYIKKNGLIIDCSVDKGAGAAAQKAQKNILFELANKTLATFKKKIEPRALEILFEKVGFHPVAVVMEMEKVALAVEDQQLITSKDVERLVSRSREDALFELTDYFGKRKLGKTLVTLNHLLDNGIHGLAILATFRNYLRKLLIFRSIQLRPTPVWHNGINAKQFQDNYLPAIKAIGDWNDMLSGHPYALFMSFSKASEFSCPRLKKMLSLLLAAELRLKSTPLPPKLVLEELMITLLGPHSSR